MRRGGAGGFCLGQILGIGGKNGGFGGADRLRHRRQCGILLLRRRQRQNPRGGPGAVADPGHHGRHVGGVFNSF